MCDFGFSFQGADGAGAEAVAPCAEVEGGFDGEDAGGLEEGGESAVGVGYARAVVVVAGVAVVLVKLDIYPGNGCFGGLVDYLDVQIAVGIVVARGEEADG